MKKDTWKVWLCKWFREDIRPYHKMFYKFKEGLLKQCQNMFKGLHSNLMQQFVQSKCSAIFSPFSQLYFPLLFVIPLIKSKKKSIKIGGVETGAVLKRSKNFRPSAVRQCHWPFDSPPTNGPSDHKKLLLTLPMSNV